MSSWHRVALLAEVPERSLFPVSAAGREWILLREGDQLRGYLDRCSHQDIKLSEFGHLDGQTILCFAHGARFSCDRGEPLCFPATEALEKADVKVEEGAVFLKPLVS